MKNKNLAPVRLYRLMNEKWALKALEERRLKIGRIHELNDPFELLGLNLRTKDLRVAMKNTKDRLDDMYGLLCFSKWWSNPVLWSHYADAHRGICLGFDVNDAHPITYDAERVVPDDDWLMRDESFKIEQMKTIIYTKFAHWHYEKEMRVICALEEKDPKSIHYFKEFGPGLKLKEVIVGPNSLLSRKRVCDAVGDLAGLTLIKARLAFKSFAVVPQKKGLR